MKSLYIYDMKNNVSLVPKKCIKCSENFIRSSNGQIICDRCCTCQCKQCGVVFFSRRAKYRDIKFCSLVCVNKWQKDNKEHRERCKALRRKGVFKKCITCDKDFYVPKWRNEGVQNTKYCSVKCRNYKEDMKGINKVLRFPKRTGVNSLEKKGADLLSKLGIKFKEQYLIGNRFVVDVFIPDKNTVIQWDGDFWHCNPKIYPIPIYKIQIINSKRDEACNAYLEKCGYNVIRFWESDVNENPEFVLSELSNHILNPSEIFN